MLANVLAVLLGLSSFTFYMSAFVYPEVHRRSDFLWSGLGMFYAVVLWFCAGQMSPSVLLGQVAAVTLLLGLGWQTLTVRREKTPVYQQTPIVLTPEVMTDWAKNKLNQLRIAPAESVPLRLEKRTLSQRNDPRRRPVYDYEFVEDGILESIPKVFSEAPVLSLDFLDEEVTLTAELDDTVPPSAEAEIISIEALPEENLDQVDAIQEAEPQAEAVMAEADENLDLNSDLIGPDAADLIEESESSAPEPKDRPFEINVAEVDSLEAAHSEPVQADLDDWGDDPIFDQPVSKRPAMEKPISQRPMSEKPMSEKPRSERPSLLAAPLILIGWVKDVVASFTRPKPARPVIDIPRREVKDTPLAVSQKESNSKESSPKESSWKEISQEDDTGEKSNWDD